MSVLVRINGKQMLRSRAITLGLIAPDGSAVSRPRPQGPRVSPPVPSAPPILPVRKRGRPKGSTNKPKTATRVDLTPEEAIKPKFVKPLIPRNVDATGTPIVDEETLAAIAKRTEEIDRARAAAK